MLPAVCFGAHPLVTDDTGTQGAGKWQLEINTDNSSQKVDQERTTINMANLGLTYGLTEQIDLGLNLPYLRVSDDGGRRSGLSDAALMLKWRYYQKDGFSLALKPQINLRTGDETRGFGNGRIGYGVNALAMLELKDMSLLANLGYTRNNNRVGNRIDLWNVSAGALLGIGERTRFVADLGAYRNPDPSSGLNPAFATIGLIHGVNDSLDLDVGVKKGLNKAEIDYSLGAGLTYRW